MIGFVMMLLINELFSHEHNHDCENETNNTAVGNQTEENQEQAKKLKAKDMTKQAIMATFGLCVHSVADGVALGASLYLSFNQEESALGITVLLALLLHKVPESAGFGSFLRTKTVAMRVTFWSLFSFSATTPIVALITYLTMEKSKSNEA